jgi:hypothetical protein
LSYEFRPAKRENVPLLIGLAGGTGSGKTMSAFELAKGLAGGNRFAVIDTEAGRAKHYADDFDFDHADLTAPFRPESYLDAIVAADTAGYPVVVVDSASHEHAGEGGLLDWHEEELTRMAGEDWKRREALTFAAWIKPKKSHKQFVNRLLQLRSHLILCFRAEEKIEIVKEGGKTVVRPKQSRIGADGWVPICEKNLPYELTVSFLLTADAPGVPRRIKLQEQHRPFFPKGTPITSAMGAELAAWAAGGTSPARARGAAAAQPEPAAETGTDPVAADVGVDTDQTIAELTDQLLSVATDENRDAIESAIARNKISHWAEPAKHIAWLQGQVERVGAAA